MTTDSLTEKSNLKPCPFCGSKPVSSRESENHYYIGCADDECDVSPFICGEEIEDIVDIWNKRIDDKCAYPDCNCAIKCN